MSLVCVALGSNLGDRQAHLEWAVARLSGLLHTARFSITIETEPVDVSDPQPHYLNAVVVGETVMAAPALLSELMVFERERGRDRRAWHEARTLDLDLIFYGDEVIDEPGLAVPHPRFRDRRFVLGPLAELEPAWRDPVTGLTVRELLLRLTEKEGKKEKGA